MSKVLDELYNLNVKLRSQHDIPKVEVGFNVNKDGSTEYVLKLTEAPEPAMSYNDANVPKPVLCVDNQFGYEVRPVEEIMNPRCTIVVHFNTNNRRLLSALKEWLPKPFRNILKFRLHEKTDELSVILKNIPNSHSYLFLGSGEGFDDVIREIERRPGNVQYLPDVGKDAPPTDKEISEIVSIIKQLVDS